MDDQKFELEQNLDDEIEEELDEEYEEERGPGIYILLAVFIILFLTTLSFFVYYQFYLGEGKWDFSFKKRTGSAVVLNKELKQENEMLVARVDSLEQSLATSGSMGTDSTSASAINDNNGGGGEIFPQSLAGEKWEVQIGAFTNFDFTKYDPYLQNMNIDKENGVTKLVIGRFNSFDEACAMSKDLKKVGIGNFIVKKVDGKRVKFNQWCN